MREVLKVLSLDLIRSLRRTLKSALRAPLATVWFLLLLLVGEGMIILGVLLGEETITPLRVTPGRVFILLSFLFLAKTNYHLRRELNPSGVFQIVYTTPGGAAYIKWEKVIYILLTNLYLYTLFLLPFTVLSIIMGAKYNVDHSVALLLVLVPLLPTLTGCTMAAGRYLIGKGLLSPRYALLTAPFAIYVSFLEMAGPLHTLMALPFLLAAQLLLFNRYFAPWGVLNAFRESPRGPAMHPITRRGDKGREIPTLAGIFWVIRRRTHDVAGSITTFSFIAAAEIYLALRTPGEVILREGANSTAWRIAPPATAAFLIFVASSLEVLLPAMLFLGVDSRRLWLLRTAPVSPLHIIKGKMRSILLLSPLIVPAAALPMATIRNFPPSLIVYLTITAVASIYMSATIGLLAGVKYYDEVKEGEGFPPVVPLYSTFMASLAIHVVEIGSGAAFYLKNHFYGVLAIVAFCAFNFYLYHFILGWCTEHFKKMDL